LSNSFEVQYEERERIIVKLTNNIKSVIEKLNEKDKVIEELNDNVQKQKHNTAEMSNRFNETNIHLVSKMGEMEEEIGIINER
jgi:uncharacterized coiled-coil protein SlyX